MRSKPPQGPDAEYYEHSGQPFGIQIEYLGNTIDEVALRRLNAEMEGDPERDTTALDRAREVLFFVRKAVPFGPVTLSWWDKKPDEPWQQIIFRIETNEV